MSKRAVEETVEQYLDKPTEVVVERRDASNIVLLGEPKNLEIFGQKYCRGCQGSQGIQTVRVGMGGGVVRVRCQPGNGPMANVHCAGW